MSITDRLLAAEKQADTGNRPTTVLQRSAVLDELKRRSVESLFRRIGARINDASLTELQLRDFVRAELEVILQEEHVLLGSDRACAADARDRGRRARPRSARARCSTTRRHRDHGQGHARRSTSSATASSRWPTRRSAPRSNCAASSSASWARSAAASTSRRRWSTRACTDGSRVNAVIPPLALRGSSLTIRKFAKTPFTHRGPDQLRVDEPRSWPSCSSCASAAASTSSSRGGTGTGKTTLLNVLSAFIPDGRAHRHDRGRGRAPAAAGRTSCSWRPARPTSRARGEVTIRDLVKNSLRMRPDRIVVGECRGGEALDMLQAMNTGHDGSITTLHANTPRDCIARLETLVLMAGMDLPLRAIREQIGVGRRPDRADLSACATARAASPT